MSPHALYLVRMDVAHDLEPTFNDVYDKEHLPLLQAVPGIVRGSRYRQPSPTEPRYLAAYELTSAAVLQSPAWKAAGEAGRWPGEIRPRTMNRHLATYEWVGSSPALTYRTPYIFWVMMDIEPHREALFNELYDVEHVPLLLKLPGCVNVVRYRTETPASRATWPPTRWTGRTCRCPSCGTTPLTSAAGSPRCGRTPTTRSTS